MDDDGSDVTLLTDTQVPPSPRWSPNGKQIVFVKGVNPALYDRHIFLMNADGTHIRQLTEPAAGKDDYHPAFSPDGTSIVFCRQQRINNEETHRSISLMDLETGKIKNLAAIGANDPGFTPDGKQITFSGIPKFGKSGANIWIMAADGGNVRELLLPLIPGDPLLINRLDSRFSPDGKKMFYWQSETMPAIIDGTTHLIPQGYYYFIYDMKTKQSRRLDIPKTYKCAGAALMDDGQSVILSAWEIKLGELVNEPRDYNIYKYHIWTGKLTRLTDNSGNDYAPDWISDQTFSVTPQSKKKSAVGNVKEMTPGRCR
jgi:Tol biopolymer transport system component